NILNENGLNVCSGTTTHTNLSLSNCSLTTNKTWKAKVVAETSVGITLEKSFDFITDYSAPAVQITNISTNDETKNATIHFNVQDVAPGKIATTTCLIFSPATALTPVSKDCKNLSSVQYTGLADTEHMVKVVATDSAGNVGEASANFKIKTLVCD